MSNAVFQSGTVLKRDVTAFIRDAFANAGWQQVSTDIANDGYIFYSTGEDGNKKNYIRMMASGTYRFDYDDTGYVIDFWILKDYVPNPGGSGPGTMTIGLNEISVAMVNGASNLTFNTTAEYFIHTNKDRMILFLEWPPSLGDLKTHVLYLGSATTFYSETQGQSNTILASSMGTAWDNVIALPNNNLNTLNNGQIMYWYYTLANTNPDREGKFYLSEFYFGDTVEGYRGKIEDIYLLPPANVIWKDEIVVDTQTFRIMVPQVYGYPWFNSFPPGTYLAIRIA